MAKFPKPIFSTSVLLPGDLRQQTASSKPYRALADVLSTADDPDKADLTARAEILNQKVRELEVRLRRVPYRIEAEAEIDENISHPDWFAIGFSKVGADWRLVYSDLDGNQKVRKRVLDEVSLAAKAESLQLLPTLLSSMKAKHAERITELDRAEKAIEAALSYLGNAEKEGA